MNTKHTLPAVTSSMHISLAAALSDLLGRQVEASWTGGRWSVNISTSTTAWYSPITTTSGNDCLLMVETCIGSHYDLASIPVARPFSGEQTLSHAMTVLTAGNTFAQAAA
jgi:hypothetical protein